MKTNQTDILVYMHCFGMIKPKYIGLLTSQFIKGKTLFCFQYDQEWIKTEKPFLLDPDMGWFSGFQYPKNKENFGIFNDSMPDTWGRTLMKRKFALETKNVKVKPQNLNDVDFLLGVYDEGRMGALRFKLEPNGPFLDNNQAFPTPPWSFIRNLQQGVKIIESGVDNKEANKWLNILLAPGSSLGGARPKANIFDANKDLWIAKFPSKSDTIDKAIWEYLVYKLALKAGINMSDSKIQKVSGNFHTFFTKRFDRINGERIHFASAMTMTGKNESIIQEDAPSYLEIAEFIQFACNENEKDLHQLWRRIVFNIAISNTDDHLRNHGFLFKNGNWKLSPAFDINSSIDKDGLSLNIDMDNNSLDFNLAKNVGKYFQLNNKQMNAILDEVKSVVSKWKSLSSELGISKSEQRTMSRAFKIRQ